jgi:hypothetical protein
MLSNRDLLAKTLQAEAGNQGLGGMMAVGSVIMNRVGSGQSLSDIILAPGQFSAWNSVTGYAGGEQGQDMDAIKPSDDAYAAADAILSGNYADVTGGATHYYNPDISQPKWGASAGGDWTKIGAHLFGKADAPKRGKPTMDGQQPMPMQAQPTAQQMQQTQRQPRGLMDFLRDPRTRQAFASMDRSGLFKGIAEQAERDVEKQEVQQTANRTAAWLKTQPGGEPYARAIESGMDARAVYTQYMQRSKPTKATYGMTPHFIKDADGNVKVVQFSNTGEQKVSDLPEGFKLAKGVDKVDAGTHFELRDAVTGELLGTVDKNVGEVKAEEVIGKAEGQAKLDLPRITAQGNRTIQLIDSILSAPFQNILGAVQGRVQPNTPGAELAVGKDGVGLIVKLQQLQGTVFLQAFESLKGGGQITELEGAKAEQAAARLNRFQSPQDFASALNDLRDVIAEGMAAAQRNAESGEKVNNPYKGSVSFSAGETSAAPATTTQDGWKEKSGGVRIRKKPKDNED